jgi:hypothetical protein
VFIRALRSFNVAPHAENTLSLGVLVAGIASNCFAMNDITGSLKSRRKASVCFQKLSASTSVTGNERYLSISCLLSVASVETLGVELLSYQIANQHQPPLSFFCVHLFGWVGFGWVRSPLLGSFGSVRFQTSNSSGSVRFGRY